jgi:hypothetical protein
VGDDTAVGVAEQRDPLEPEVGAQLFEIGDVVIGRVRTRIGRTVRPLGAARIEQDEREALAEAGEVAEGPR